MSAVSIEDFAPTSGQRCYLDTSALIPLALHQLASAGGPAPPDEERRRADRIRRCIDRLVSAKASVVTTILAMEELAAKVRNDARNDQARAHGSTWKDLKRSDPAKARELDEGCRDWMLKMMEHAARSTGDLGVSFELPVVLEGDASAAATRLRKVHREYLRRYVSLDAMDALHIAVGRMIGADCFVSFDAGWREVSDITVCY